MDQKEIIPPARYLWQPSADGGVRLLRVYGTKPELTLPEEISGKPLTEIGAYCFAASEHLPDNSVQTSDVGDVRNKEKYIFPICGENLMDIILPDTVKVIGNAAFYNCKCLRRLEIGKTVIEIGSDVFMNCRNLCQFDIRGNIKNASGAKHILSRISTELEVRFMGDPETGRKAGSRQPDKFGQAEQCGGRVQAALLYPEYSETYDEIAPAHVFGANISGEGFRARQFFQDNVIQIEQYDSVFTRAMAEETVETLGQMALNRLRYPVSLRVQDQEIYEDFVREHGLQIGKNMVLKKNQDMLHFICREKYLSTMALEDMISFCTEQGWGEGAASLMDWRYRYYSGGKQDRYSFDD